MCSVSRLQFKLLIPVRRTDSSGDGGAPLKTQCSAEEPAAAQVTSPGGPEWASGHSLGDSPSGGCDPRPVSARLPVSAGAREPRETHLVLNDVRLVTCRFIWPLASEASQLARCTMASNGRG